MDDTIAQHGRAIIVDLHSFPSRPLPYELNQTAAGPGICIGTDRFHTPARLLAAAQDAFADIRGGTGINTPFAGTYVPLRHLYKAAQVSSTMVEMRRDLYQAEPGVPISAEYLSWWKPRHVYGLGRRTRSLMLGAMLSTLARSKKTAHDEAAAPIKLPRPGRGRSSADTSKPTGHIRLFALKRGAE